MASKPPKACTYPMCSQVATQRGKCESHQPKQIVSMEKRTNDKFYSTSAWRNTRTRILYRDPLCVVCLDRGIYTDSEHVDHIIRRGHCNPFDLNNLAGMCHSCHSSKTRYESQFYTDDSYVGDGRNKYERYIKRG